MHTYFACVLKSLKDEKVRDSGNHSDETASVERMDQVCDLIQTSQRYKNCVFANQCMKKEGLNLIGGGDGNG